MKISAERNRELSVLSEVLGVEFKDKGLLNQALTHTSYANEHGTMKLHNERLEFLGDAVLELASSTYLFKHFPEMSEGNMSRARANLVCEESLASLARQMNIGDYLLLSKGESLHGGRDRDSILADAFESIIGAIYLDNGWDIALQFVCKNLVEKLKAIENGFITRDYKSILQEHAQGNGQTIKYNLLSSEGPAHAMEFTMNVTISDKVMGKGVGNSKKHAEQKAAKEALIALGVK